MAQTKEGAIKVAAKRIGISFDEYQRRIAQGEKWCHGCKAWHPISEFLKDSTRGDGLSAICQEYRNKQAREKYVPVPEHERKGHGPERDPNRSGDKKQARKRINQEVAIGNIPNPNDLPCVDCAHIGDDRRHEYDHYLGYSEEYFFDVESVCSRCHHHRARARGEIKQKQDETGRFLSKERW